MPNQDDLISIQQFPSACLKPGRFTIFRRERGAPRFIFIATLDSFDSAWNVGRASGGDMETIVVKLFEPGNYVVWFSPYAQDTQQYAADGSLVEDHKLAPDERAWQNLDTRYTSPPAPSVVVEKAINRSLETREAPDPVPTSAQRERMDRLALTYRAAQDQNERHARHERLLSTSAPILASLAYNHAPIQIGEVQCKLLASDAINLANALLDEWERNR